MAITLTGQGSIPAKTRATHASTRLTQPVTLRYHTHQDHSGTSPRKEEAMATTATTQQTYNVGGVMLKQPFKIRRLGQGRPQ